jgi:hypothetical protein
MLEFAHRLYCAEISRKLRYDETVIFGVKGWPLTDARTARFQKATKCFSQKRLRIDFHGYADMTVVNEELPGFSRTHRFQMTPCSNDANTPPWLFPFGVKRIICLLEIFLEIQIDDEIYLDFKKCL